MPRPAGRVERRVDAEDLWVARHRARGQVEPTGRRSHRGRCGGARRARSRDRAVHILARARTRPATDRRKLTCSLPRPRSGAGTPCPRTTRSPARRGHGAVQRVVDSRPSRCRFYPVRFTPASSSTRRKSVQGVFVVDRRLALRARPSRRRTRGDVVEVVWRRLRRRCLDRRTDCRGCVRATIQRRRGPWRGEGRSGCRASDRSSPTTCDSDHQKR